MAKARQSTERTSSYSELLAYSEAPGILPGDVYRVYWQYGRTDDLRNARMYARVQSAAVRVLKSYDVFHTAFEFWFKSRAGRSRQASYPYVFVLVRAYMLHFAATS